MLNYIILFQYLNEHVICQYYQVHYVMLMLQVIPLLAYPFIHLLTHSFIALDKSKSSLFYLKAALLGNCLKRTYLLTHSLDYLLRCNDFALSYMQDTC